MELETAALAQATLTRVRQTAVAAARRAMLAMVRQVAVLVMLPVRSNDGSSGGAGCASGSAGGGAGSRGVTPGVTNVGEQGTSYLGVLRTTDFGLDTWGGCKGRGFYL